MNDAWLDGVESEAEHHMDRPTSGVIVKLVAEIRRLRTEVETLRGERDDAEARGRKLRSVLICANKNTERRGEQRDKARGLVDGLLAAWPRRKTTQGRICPRCYSHESLHALPCPYVKAIQQRDWEPQEGGTWTQEEIDAAEIRAAELKAMWVGDDEDV